MNCICGDNNQTLSEIHLAIRELECRFADVVERLHLLEEYVEECNEEEEGDEDYEDDPSEEEDSDDEPDEGQAEEPMSACPTA